MRGETSGLSLYPLTGKFQSTPLMRGETSQPTIYRQALGISIHSPHARGDISAHSIFLHHLISIHSPHARGDGPRKDMRIAFVYFNPLPSCEGRQGHRLRAVPRLHFNPLPSCEGRRLQLTRYTPHLMISIHSPHARGDRGVGRYDYRHFAISIHSPHARGDVFGVGAQVKIFEFQSTPLMRGETSLSSEVVIHTLFQSTPLMRGETCFDRYDVHPPRISIHSPHARGDLVIHILLLLLSYFNPLPSCEGRRYLSARRQPPSHFNPLPSCEGRLIPLTAKLAANEFQSTPLMRGETSWNNTKFADIKISIHSPHARGDMRDSTIHGRDSKFQSTPLMRGETKKATITHATLKFQSTPLMRGETLEVIDKIVLQIISIHSPHARGDAV